MTWISVKKLHYLLMRLAGGDPVTHRIASGRLYAADGDTRRFVVRSDMPQALYTFKVDHSLFRLAVDAMRIHSLATCGFETVSATSMKGLENFVVCRDPAPLFTRREMPTSPVRSGSRYAFRCTRMTCFSARVPMLATPRDRQPQFDSPSLSGFSPHFTEHLLRVHESPQLPVVDNPTG